MIAFHYPPVAGSSGVHRTHKFARYLPEYGWHPTVLTVDRSAHVRTTHDENSAGVRVERAFALDTARHLAFRGRYLGWLALPDRWISWWPAAVVKGLRLIRRHRPDVIWSTFPIGTAHLIGLTLHRLSGVPWVADFRDPMTETDPATGIEYPLDPAIRRVQGWIEHPTVTNCARAVFTTPGTAAMYAAKFPGIPAERWAIVANGYDEEDFLAAERLLDGTKSRNGERLLLVHSGLLYPDVRDPRPFFSALDRLRAQGKVTSQSVRIVLRASGNEALYAELLRRHDIEDIVSLEPPIAYREALIEMLTADALMIFQAASCNCQIPAKAYECLRAGRPILALTDAAGDTAQVLRDAGIDTILPLHDVDAICDGFVAFLDALRARRAPVATWSAVSSHSRRSRTRELADVLNQAIDTRSASPSRRRHAADEP